MYSTIAVKKHAKGTGKIVGTHQKLDRIARANLSKLISRDTFFPSVKEILHFEGIRGPDGLKRKSPGKDEPEHFYLSGSEEKFEQILLDHQYNLRIALSKKDSTRAAFEAAWLAHAVADGLTPAHHFPLHDVVEDLMSDKDFFKFFGEPIKGIMRGDTVSETIKNNWQYWGINGVMSRHIAFELCIAAVANSSTARELSPKISKIDLKNVDLITEFRTSVTKIQSLDLYGRFGDRGWTPSLRNDIYKDLLPEAIRMIIIAWYASIPEKVGKKCA